MNYFSTKEILNYSQVSFCTRNNTHLQPKKDTLSIRDKMAGFYIALKPSFSRRFHCRTIQ